MLKLSNTDQKRLLDWAGPRCGTDDWPSESEAMAVVDGDEIKAVMVINAIYGRQCYLHFATDRTKQWASRRIISDLLGYVFIYKRIDRANTVCARTNTANIVMLVKLGFNFEGVLREGRSDGEDGILFAMLASECRWIENCIWNEKGSHHGE